MSVCAFVYMCVCVCTFMCEPIVYCRRAGEGRTQGLIAMEGESGADRIRGTLKKTLTRTEDGHLCNDLAFVWQL